MRRAPGFVTASLHRSNDGTKVTMYAQWRSIDDYQAMRQDPLPFLQEDAGRFRSTSGTKRDAVLFDDADEQENTDDGDHAEIVVSRHQQKQRPEAGRRQGREDGDNRRGAWG